MGSRISSRFDLTLGPVLWGAGATIVLSAVVMFVLDRPGWLVPAAFVAGGVAGFRSGPYDPAANNGVVGVLVSLPILLFLMMLYYNLTAPGSVTAGGDSLFFGAVISTTNVLVYGLTMMIVAYLGGIAVDYAKRRVAVRRKSSERESRFDQI